MNSSEPNCSLSLAASDPCESDPPPSTTINITVINGFTWPEPEQRLSMTASADKPSAALLRETADKVGYMYDDVYLVRQSGTPLSTSEAEDAPSLSDEGVAEGHTLRIVLRSRAMRSRGALVARKAASDPSAVDLYPPIPLSTGAPTTLPPASSPVIASTAPASASPVSASPDSAPPAAVAARSRGVSSELLSSYFRDSRFILEWARDAPRVPVLLRSVQLRHGYLPNPAAPGGLDACIKAPELNDMLTELASITRDALDSLDGAHGASTRDAILDAAAEAAAVADPKGGAALAAAKAAKFRKEESADVTAGSEQAIAPAEPGDKGTAVEAATPEQAEDGSLVSEEPDLGGADLGGADLGGAGGDELAESTPSTSAVVSPCPTHDVPCSPSDDKTADDVADDVATDDVAASEGGAYESTGDASALASSEATAEACAGAASGGSPSLGLVSRAVVRAARDAVEKRAKAEAAAEAAVAERAALSEAGSKGRQGQGVANRDDAAYEGDFDAVVAAFGGDDSLVDLGFPLGLLPPLNGGHKISAGGAADAHGTDAAGKHLDELFGMFFDYAEESDQDAAPQASKRPKGGKGAGGGKKAKGQPAANPTDGESSSGKASRPKGGKGKAAGGAAKAAPGAKAKQTLAEGLPAGLISSADLRKSNGSVGSGVSRQSTQPESERASSSSRSSSPTEVMTEGQLSVAASPTRESLMGARKVAVPGKRARGAAAKGGASGKRAKQAATELRIGWDASGGGEGSLLDGALTSLGPSSMAELAALSGIGVDLDDAADGFLAMDFAEANGDDSLTSLGLLTPGESLLADGGAIEQALNAVAASCMPLTPLGTATSMEV